MRIAESAEPLGASDSENQRTGKPLDEVSGSKALSGFIAAPPATRSLKKFCVVAFAHRKTKNEFGEESFLRGRSPIVEQNPKKMTVNWRIAPNIHPPGRSEYPVDTNQVAMLSSERHWATR